MPARRTLSPVRALGRRDFGRYFNNPIGYVFITLFIFLSGVAAFWQPQFFLRNLANLDAINEVMPYLLLFFVSALTLGTWADETRQGTDELLLTLPATDAQIVLGKYAAALGIYTVSLLLSLSHVIVLVQLGNPDAGLLAANYLGYWLLGASLIPVGMLASIQTSNASVAFILAALFCSGPILVNAAAPLLGDAYAQRIAPLGAVFQFNDFARGVVRLDAVLYFVSLAALFLLLNVITLRRRRGVARRTRVARSHGAVRIAAALVALAAGHVLVARAGIRVDATAGRLHSLGAETRRLLAALPSDRAVLVQAFVSPEVPREYVQLREGLLATLRDVQAAAPRGLQLIVTETRPYTDEARAARERFGIVPRLVSDPDGGTGGADQVFLGVAFTSGAEEQVIPFFDRGLAPEYEVTRAIRVVTRGSRKRIGIIDTDAKMFGGVDAASGRPRPPWAIVGELRKQYDVMSITPYRPIVEPLDALLVVLPSMLLQVEMDNVLAAVRSGVPTLLLVDPIPTLDIRLAPAAPMAARVDPYATPDQALVRKNTGDIQQFMSSLGVVWPPTRIAWDSYSPHPELSQLPKEVVFVGRSSGSTEAFSVQHAATSGLQELMLMYAGYLQRSDDPGLTFTPLVQTSRLAGTESYFQVVQPTPAGPTINMNLERTPQDEQLVLAAEIRSTSQDAKASRMIVIADLDFISDQAFEMRASAPANVTVDNIPFFLNCIDVLAGDESFVELRRRRVTYRTLERVEAQTRTFIERRTQEERRAAADAQAALDAAQARLQEVVASIGRRQDLDPQAKQMMARNVEVAEARRLEVLRASIEQEKARKIQASRQTMEVEVLRIQNSIRMAAVLLPPVPACALGIWVFMRRRRREREAAAAARRVREGS